MDSQPKLPFKQRVSFEERKNFAIQLRQKKPNYVPLVVEADPTSDSIELKKDRFFIPEESKVSDFVKVLIDKYVETDENIAISSISVRIQTPNKAIQPSNEDSIGSLYGLHQEADGYLYFIVYRESAFGCVF